MAKKKNVGPVVEQPCVSCGEETAVGSIFFSDRRTIHLADDGHAFLCTLCDQRLAASRKGHRLTDDQTRRLIVGGSLAMIAAVPGGH